VTVLPHPFITEISSPSPLRLSPPVSTQALFKKSSISGHSVLPYIEVDEKQREAGRHIVVPPPQLQQQPQQPQASSSSIASFYAGNCLPVYRISSTLNNIQPLQIVSQVPAPPPGIALPDLMKRDTPTAH